MSVDMDTFRGFAGQIAQLGQMARPVELDDHERVSRVKAEFDAKLNQTRATYLESCVHCGVCAEACHFFLQTGEAKYAPVRKMDLLQRHYRRERSPMRWLFRLWTKEITLDDLMEWQELVYDSCTECGRCMLVCPMGIDIADIVNVTRQAYARAELVPAELTAMEQEQSESGNIFRTGPDDLRRIATELEQEGIPIPIDKERADYVLVTSAIEILLFKDALRSAARVLNHLGYSWTVQSCAFEGANFGMLSGYEDVQATLTNRLMGAAVSVGAKTVIIPECGHAYPAARWYGANALGAPLPFKVLHLSEFLGREVRTGRLKLKPIKGKRTVTYHDPCKVGRVGGVFDEPRAVLKAMGMEHRELPDHGVANFCCGGGAGNFLINRAQPLRQKTFELKRKQTEMVEAEALVTACSSCRMNFLGGADASGGWDRSIESLVELVGEQLDDGLGSGAARPASASP
jgi:Fe-S oxidoreductase